MTDLAALADEDGAGEPGGAATSGRRAGLAGAVGALVGRLGALGAPIGRLAGLAPRPVLVGVGAGLSVVLLTVLVASVFGGRTTAEARESHAAAAHEPIVEEVDLLPFRPTPRPISTRPAAPTPSPTPLWEQREAGWFALGAPVLRPAHLLPAEHLRLLDGVERARTIDVQFRVLLKSGSSAPVWGVLLSYQSELEHTRLQFFADDYDAGRPYVALHTARNGKDGPVAKPQRVLDYDFWGRDSHRLTIQIGDQQVRAVLDGRQLGRWSNPGIMAAPKGLYVLGGSHLQFESFSAPLAQPTP